MPAIRSPAFTKQRLCLEFVSLKHAAPEGVYVAPVPEEPLQWCGVLFVRKGPYANAVLRFQIDFPPEYPARPPVVSLLSDVFHPLVTPLTTYTYSTRDTGAETVSATDQDRLPPGGLSLRHGFPEWFGAGARDARSEDIDIKPIEVLQYLRIVFDTEAVLDSAPLETAANSGAWHAWRSYRAHIFGRTVSPVAGIRNDATEESARDGSLSPRQQPGGARRPGEWNWQGVWEDRVRKSIRASVSDNVLFGGEQADVVCFSKMDTDAIQQVATWTKTSGTAT